MRTSASSSSGGSRRRVVALLALLALPWTLVVSPNGTTLVFPWGLVNPSPLAVTTLYDYLLVYTQGLPDRLLAWPASVLLYAGAIASALGEPVVGREDPRVTAALLVLAGLNHGVFALGLSGNGTAAVPLGTGLLWAGAVVVYRRGG